MIYNVKFDRYFFINLNYKISREISRNPYKFQNLYNKYQYKTRYKLIFFLRINY